MKYNVRMVNRLYLDVLVEAENIPTARQIASDIANKATRDEWAEWGDIEVFEVEFSDDGILTIV